MLSLIAFFFLQSAEARDCKYPFPVWTGEKSVAACLKANRMQTVGHLLFVHFPKAVYSNEDDNSTLSYFHNTAKTRAQLCRILQMKRQLSDYSLADKSGSALTYSDQGFQLEKKAKTLKMLACSLI